MATREKRQRVVLPPDIAERLKNLGPDFEESKRQMAALRKMGLDTRDLEEKLEWAETAQKVLLEDFT